MWIALQPLRFFTFTFVLAALASSAQSPPKALAGSEAVPAIVVGETLSPDMARRIEVLIRSKSDIPYDYVFHIGPLSKSDVPGYDSVTVVFSANGKSSKPLPFLVSKDRKTLAQFTSYDISRDPRLAVSGADRPARGGKLDAPVLIVVFDDLECPFCARSNAHFFPAILDRYKDQVRIVYRDFPLSEIHPWAMRAAIDTNCVGAQSGTGYWNLIDYVHGHADEIGGKEKTLAKANETLDSLTREEGKKQKVDEAKLAACVEKQDPSVVTQSLKEGEALGVDAAPAIFINGEKIEGAQPMEFIYGMIDGALIAAGQKPPVPAPAMPASGTPAASATKPGN